MSSAPRASLRRVRQRSPQTVIARFRLEIISFTSVTHSAARNPLRFSALGQLGRSSALTSYDRTSSAYILESGEIDLFDIRDDFTMLANFDTGKE